MDHIILTDRRRTLCVRMVAFKKPGISYGHIQFIFPGSEEPKLYLGAASFDDNTVTFQHWQKKEFEALKDAIEV